MEDVTYQCADPVLHVILMQFVLPQETRQHWRRNDRFGLNLLDYRPDLVNGPSLNGHPFARYTTNPVVGQVAAAKFDDQLGSYMLLLLS